MKKNLIAFVALIAALALTFCACGTDTAETTGSAADAPQTTLALKEWTMTTSTWSSPNGATVHLTAIPESYTEGQTAAFVVRLEGEDVDSIPCQWDGTSYTADAELNAADGYCYYVILAGADGTQAEIAINTPAEPTNEAIINMASSLESYCSITVESSAFADGVLTITGGTAKVQAPRITNDGETITCSGAVLVLTGADGEIASMELALGAMDEDGSYTWHLTDSAFTVPELEDDQQVELRMDVTLSNGQTLTTSGGTWYALDGDLLMAVG